MRKKTRVRMTLVVGTFSVLAVPVALSWWLIAATPRMTPWVAVTELVVPLLIGLAGLAIAVSTYLASRRASADEAVQAERARRQPLARIAIEFLIGATQEYATRNGGRRARVGTKLGDLVRELELHAGTEGVVAVTRGFAIALETAEPTARGTTDEIQAFTMLRGRWVRDARDALGFWAQHPNERGAMLRQVAARMPKPPPPPDGIVIS